MKLKTPIPGAIRPKLSTSSFNLFQTTIGGTLPLSRSPPQPSRYRPPPFPVSDMASSHTSVSWIGISAIVDRLSTYSFFSPVEEPQFRCSNIEHLMGAFSISAACHPPVKEARFLNIDDDGNCWWPEMVFRLRYGLEFATAIHSFSRLLVVST